MFTINVISRIISTGVSTVTSTVSRRSQSKISTDIEKLEVGIQKFDQAMTEYANAQHKIVSVHNAINQYWEGDAAELYKSKLRNFSMTIGRSTNTMFKIRGIAADRINKLESQANTSRSISDIFRSIIL